MAIRWVDEGRKGGEMTYQLLQNKHKLSADLMIADTLSQNRKISGKAGLPADPLERRGYALLLIFERIIK